MNWRGSVYLLVSILLGGCGGTVLMGVEAADAQAAGHPNASFALGSHTAPDSSINSSYVLTVGNSGPVLATTSAVLAQGKEKDVWQATVILSQATEACPGPVSNYWLETTAPNRATQASAAVRIGHGPCRVTLTFKGAPRAPESASLVLDEAGALSSTPLTLKRYVTGFDYIWLPAIFGAIMIVALLLMIELRIRIREEGSTWKWISVRQFWTRPASAPDARNAAFIPIATLVATFIGAGTLASSLFPGISLSFFGALTASFELIAVAIGGIVYGYLYRKWERGQSPDTLGYTLELTSDDAEAPAAEISEFGGADIRSAAEMTVTQNQTVTKVSASSKLTIPSGSTIKIINGDLLSFPEGPDVLLKGSCSLLVSSESDGVNITHPGGAINLPATIRVTGDATISYAGESADLMLYSARVAVPLGRRYKNKSFTLKSERPAKAVGSMLVVIFPLLASIFAIGAELGIIGVLSIDLSDATRTVRFFAFDLLVAIAIFALSHSLSTIRSTANPQPTQP